MLSQQDRDRLAKELINMAFMYGRENTTPEFYSTMISSLDKFFNLSLDKYLVAINSYMRDQKNKTFPSPMALRPYLEPELDSDTRGKLAAARVIEAVSKFGYTNPTEAKQYIGELGWNAVSRFGGWTYVCENLGVTIQITTFQAQARDLCVSADKSFSAGFGDMPIALPRRQEDLSIGHNENVSNLLALMSKK